MKQILVVTVLGLVLWGCGGTDQPNCVCKGKVPSGESVDLQCGETACLDSGGWLCAADNQLEPSYNTCPSPSVACVPHCSGHNCGDDGCSGSCGSCASGDTCQSGRCTPPCQPDCTNKECGNDGCGGSCGSCADGRCIANLCQCTSATAAGDCHSGESCVTDTMKNTSACYQPCDPFSASCPSGQWCNSALADNSGAYSGCASSGTKLENQSCTSATDGGGDCADGMVCVKQSSTGNSVCMKICDHAHVCKSTQSCETLYANGKAVNWGGCNPPQDACTPNPCTTAHKTACTIVAGAPSCACDSGYADMGGTCQCVPQCAGKNCGADGCGGFCGTCSSTQTCDVGGHCQCKPQCTGKSCGDNGCGGTCGTCGAQSVCNAGGQCICTPNCGGKSCGSDGCSGTCGTCDLGKICSLGSCVTCTPQCSGKSCGDNSCGGTCGTCALGSSCSAGNCVADPVVCDPVGDSGCSGGNSCILLSNETTRCALAGSGTQGSSCSATVTCAGGYSCFAGSCRKICDKGSGTGCPINHVCNGVAGWSTYGACT